MVEITFTCKRKLTLQHQCKTSSTNPCLSLVGSMRRWMR